MGSEIEIYKELIEIKRGVFYLIEELEKNKEESKEDEKKKKPI